jgi:hypothetical protein
MFDNTNTLIDLTSSLPIISDKRRSAVYVFQQMAKMQFAANKYSQVFDISVGVIEDSHNL